MKIRLLLGLIVSGLLCSCVSTGPYSETVIDTTNQTRHTMTDEGPERVPLSVPVGTEPSTSHW
jgi:hypothetical protein